MDKLLPIGTVIDVNNGKLIILGYREHETTKYEFSYIVGFFPFAFNGNPKSLSLLPIDTDYKVVFDGYTDSATERYLLDKLKRISILQQTTPEDVTRASEIILGISEEKSDE